MKTVCYVSIPRSGFCSFRLPGGSAEHPRNPSFNPSFGILLIQTEYAGYGSKKGKSSFNPSFGILLIQTPGYS